MNILSDKAILIQKGKFIMTKTFQNQTTDNRYQVKSEKEYLKVYQCLFSHADYTHLSNDAKILFTLIANRVARVSCSDFSKIYKDTQGCFVQNDRKYYAELLGRSPESVSRYLRQLEAVGLITKTKHRIYPSKPKTSLKTHRYTNREGVEKLSFYKLPKVLFHDDRYKSMDNNTKMVYALLRHRYEFTVKKGDETGITDYKDEKGLYFCRYCIDSLSKVLNIKADTIRKCKNRLIALSLLKQVQEEQFVTYKTTYRMYVTLPKKTQEAEDEIQENTVETEPLQTSDSMGSKCQNVKNRPSEMSKIGTSNTAYNKTDIESTSNVMNDNDVNKYATYQEYANMQEAIHTAQYTFNFKANSLETDFERTRKEYKLRNYPENTATYLKLYSIEDIEMLKGIIVKSKKDINRIYYMDYTLEELDYVIAKTLHNVKREKKGESVQQLLSYYKSAIMKEIKKVVDEEDLTRRFYNLSKPMIDAKNPEVLTSKELDELGVW